MTQPCRPQCHRPAFAGHWSHRSVRNGHDGGDDGGDQEQDGRAESRLFGYDDAAQFLDISAYPLDAHIEFRTSSDNEQDCNICVLSNISTCRMTG